MTDKTLVERLRANQCGENMGCGVMPRCACADMDDAADRIEALESREAEEVAARMAEELAQCRTKLMIAAHKADRAAESDVLWQYTGGELRAQASKAETALNAWRRLQGEGS